MRKSSYQSFCLLQAVCSLFLASAAFAQTAIKPEENRFTKVVLAQRIEEPMQFQVLADGRVIYAERKGKLKVYDPASGEISVVAEFAVSTKYTSKTGEVTEGEDGFQGVILDPEYEKNHWLYVYYSVAGSEAKNLLVRYEWYGKGLIEASRKVMLEVVVQREECCHVGGGMVFDKNKNLYLSTGDNTFSRASDGFSPLDERPGQSARDVQKSSPNTNDLRGKILRIHPEENGSYTIPAGNLFPAGTPKTRPEIYTMGNRNPWRLSIDSKTGWLYWGEVGPDGSRDDLEKRGPQSYDEFNRAKVPGNYGWPYFVADNKAYRQYDFATRISGAPFDPARPVNKSPNNTGMVELQPAVPAFIWYSKAPSVEFPLMGSGGNSAVGGPVYRRDDFKTAKRPYPAYYEGKWFITDWVRGWLNVVEMDEQGNYKSMERFLTDLKLRGPIDIKFGPEGDLYILEYGNGYFKDNPEAQLIRIEYNGGNRRPQVQLAASKTAGAVPLKVNLSSAGTKDFDTGDSLAYEWRVTRNGAPFRTLKQPDATVTFVQPGTYKATLVVTDRTGAKNSESVVIRAGNEPPVVTMAVTSGNSMFFFPGKTIRYAVKVSDKEDGSLANKRILPSAVAVSANYLSEGYNLTAIAQKQQSVDAAVQFTGAISLMNKSDCKVCHTTNQKVLGPAYIDIAKKYKGDAGAPSALAKKIISGGAGTWGDAMMPAHPAISEKEGAAIVKYILSLADAPRKPKSLPATGTYTTSIPAGENKDGSFIFKAAYRDRGTKTAQSQSAEQLLVLNSPLIPVKTAFSAGDITFNRDSTAATFGKPGAFLSWNKLDLTGVNQIELAASSGRRPANAVNTPQEVVIEVRAGGVQGALLGRFSGEYKGQPTITVPLSGNAGPTTIYLVVTGAALQVRELRLIAD